MQSKVQEYPICEVFYEQVVDNDEEEDLPLTEFKSTSKTLGKKEEVDLFLTDSEDEEGLDDLEDNRNLFDDNNAVTLTQKLPNTKTPEKIKNALKILSCRKKTKSITTISRSKQQSNKSKKSHMKPNKLKQEKIPSNFIKKVSKVDCEKARLKPFNMAGTKESKRQQLSSSTTRLRSGKEL